MNKLFLICGVLILMIGYTSAMSIDYYFHPECGHCQKIEAFISNIINSYPEVQWNILDTSEKEYGIDGTPFLEIITTDDRKINLRGSYEIPRYLECELKEQSNLNCPTYPAGSCIRESWFIKE